MFLLAIYVIQARVADRKSLFTLVIHHFYWRKIGVFVREVFTQFTLHLRSWQAYFSYDIYVSYAWLSDDAKRMFSLRVYVNTEKTRVFFYASFSDEECFFLCRLPEIFLAETLSCQNCNG